MEKNAKPSKVAGAFWSRQKIQARHYEDKIFWIPADQLKNSNAASESTANQPPFELDNECLQAASYNLKMGGEVYVTPVRDTDARSVQTLTPNQAFVIPAGQFAFLLTYEAVNVPKNAIALLALRSFELKFRGLINVSGFHVDPGYSGRLIFAVYNAGPGPVHIREGQVLFEIFFADLDQETNKGYLGGSKNKPILRIEPRFIQSLSGEFQTLKGLDNRIDEVETDFDVRIHAIEKEQSIIRWASALLLGAVIAFGVRECSQPAKAIVPIRILGEAHD